MPTTHSATVATYFVGGAADKNRFWGIVPKTNLIRTQLILRYFDALNSGKLPMVELNKTFEACYFGHDEMDALFLVIIDMNKRTPAAKIRLVGHSLGGWQAAVLSNRLAASGIQTHLLVTIDPVGVGYFMNFPGGQYSLPRPITKQWINLAANHTIGYDVNDAVADAGIRWHPWRDTGLKTKPQFDIGTPFSHADVWDMMTFPDAAGKSAWQILFNDTP